MFHDVAIKFKFDDQGRPLWGVSIAGPESAVGFGPDLQTAAWEAQMTRRQLDECRPV